MKPISQRERVMVIALPATILFLIYYFFIAKPAGEEGVKLKREQGLVSRRVVDSREVANLRRELAEVQKVIREEKAAQTEEGKSMQGSIRGWDDSNAKAQGGKAVSDLLAANEIVLVDEALASEEDQKRFASLLESLPSAELWRFRLVSNYECMRHTVASLGDLDLPVVPAAIEMEPEVDGHKNIRLWNLWICR